MKVQERKRDKGRRVIKCIQLLSCPGEGRGASSPSCSFRRNPEKVMRKY